MNTAPRVVRLISNQSVLVGQAFQFVIAGNTFTDAETPGSLTLSVSGLPEGLRFTAPATISGTPSTTASTPFRITVMATDPGGLSASTSFELTVQPLVIDPDPTQPFALTAVRTISCDVVASDQRIVTFTPQYRGLNGQPVSFSVVNELAPTTNPGPYSLRLYTDNQTIMLEASQAGSPQAVRFSYNWLAACPTQPSGRLGTGADYESGLHVRVLGNPVVGNEVVIEVTGAQGLPLQYELTDSRGRIVQRQRVGQAGRVERQSLDISNQPAGVFLLRVNTPTQSQTVKVLRQ